MKREKQHPIVNGTQHLKITVPPGPFKQYSNGAHSHYLRIAVVGVYAGTIEGKRELKKLRTLINKILGE